MSDTEDKIKELTQTLEDMRRENEGLRAVERVVAKPEPTPLVDFRALLDRANTDKVEMARRIQVLEADLEAKVAAVKLIQDETDELNTKLAEAEGREMRAIERARVALQTNLAEHPDILAMADMTDKLKATVAEQLATIEGSQATIVELTETIRRKNEELATVAFSRELALDQDYPILEVLVLKDCGTDEVSVDIRASWDDMQTMHLMRALEPGDVVRLWPSDIKQPETP